MHVRVKQTYMQEMSLQPKEVEQLPLQYYAEVTGAWTTSDSQAGGCCGVAVVVVVVLRDCV